MKLISKFVAGMKQRRLIAQAAVITSFVTVMLMLAFALVPLFTTAGALVTFLKFLGFAGFCVFFAYGISEAIIIYCFFDSDQ